MAEHSQPEHDPKKLDPVIGVTVLLLVLAVIGYAAWAVTTAPVITEDAIGFEPLRVDRDRLVQERNERAADVDPERAGKDLERLRRAAREANAMGFRPTNELERQQTAQKLSVYANQVMPAYGYEGFIYSAEPLFIECGKGLEELLEAIRRGQITAEEATEELPEDTFEEYRQNCGNVLPVLLEQGLVSPDGEWANPSGPAIFDVLNRYRWAHVIHDRLQPIKQLTPYEQTILMRWRIEDAEAFDSDERWRFLGQARGLLDDYSADWAAGILSMRAGNLETALEHFKAAARNNEHEMADDVVEYLQDRIARGGPS